MSWLYPYYRHKLLQNFKELLEFNCQKNPDKVAFIFNEAGEQVQKTYRDFYQDVQKMTRYLKHKYLRQRHFAIISENSYNYLVTFFSIILARHVAVPIDKDLSRAEIQKLLKKSDCKFIFYSDHYCKLGKLLEKYRHQKLETISHLAAPAKSRKPRRSDKIDPDATAVIFFTSGTTSAEKGVCLSQRNILADIYASCSLFRPHGTAFSCLPFHHAFGLVTGVLMPFYYDVPTFLNSSLKRILSDIQQAQPNTMFVVPAFLETTYKQIWKTARKNNREHLLKHTMTISNTLLGLKIDLRPWLFKAVREKFGGNLEFIICGGAPLDAKYVKWFRGLGINVLNGYGITECSPVVAVNRNHANRDGSVGQVGKGIDVQIINNEVCVRGDVVMKGYYKNKKATKAALADGYFHTGDFGRIDRGGFLFITGRKKNLIVLSNGENVSPEFIESKLAEDEAVAEVVVYVQNKKLVAEVYPGEPYLGNASYFAGVLYKYNQKVPKHHQLSDIILREHPFPRNHNQKILRRKVGGSK